MSSDHYAKGSITSNGQKSAAAARELAPENVTRAQIERITVAIKAYAPSTLRSMRSAIRRYRSWAKSAPDQTLPAQPGELAAFIAEEGPHRSHATIESTIHLLSMWHRLLGFPDPTQDEIVKLTLKANAKSYARPPKQAKPLMPDPIARIVQALTQTLEDQSKSIDERKRAARDRALFLVLRDTGRRANEIVALAWRDLIKGSHAYELYFASIKNPKAAKSHTAPITDQTAAALRAWRSYCPDTQPTTSRIFVALLNGRTDDALTTKGLIHILNRNAALILGEASFGGHSARVGMTQYYADRGVPLGEIQMHHGWADPRMPISYLRHRDATKNRAFIEIKDLSGRDAPADESNS